LCRRPRHPDAEGVTLAVDRADLPAGRALQLLGRRFADGADVGNVLFRPAGRADRRRQRRRVLGAAEDSLAARRRRAADATQRAGIARVPGRGVEAERAEAQTLRIGGEIRAPRLALSARVRRRACRAATEAGHALVRRTRLVRRRRGPRRGGRPETGGPGRHPAGHHPASAQDWPTRAPNREVADETARGGVVELVLVSYKIALERRLVLRFDPPCLLALQPIHVRGPGESELRRYCGIGGAAELLAGRPEEFPASRVVGFPVRIVIVPERDAAVAIT
jgi:hypothetical protein